MFKKLLIITIISAGMISQIQAMSKAEETADTKTKVQTLLQNFSNEFRRLIEEKYPKIKYGEPGYNSAIYS